MNSKLEELVQKGLVRISKKDDLYLACYTQDCFWGKDTWNEMTRTHRGALYIDGIHRVNRAFDKIFNLNEVSDCSYDVIYDRISNEECNVYHKSNGHLFIASVFQCPKTQEQRIVYHTKGSLPNDQNFLLNGDIELFNSNHAESLWSLAETYPNSTFMFEAIVKHDPHTLYDLEVERYGSNQFVLLGANVQIDGIWEELAYDKLCDISEFLGTPIVDKFSLKEIDIDNINNWVNHTDTEGYVIHFPSDGHRVKIKTKDYWALRFKKDLSTHSILKMVQSKGDSKIINKLPEEVAVDIIDVISEIIVYWYNNILVQVDTLDKKWFEVDRKTVAESNLKKEQKSYLFNIHKNINHSDLVLSSKSLRKMFVKDMVSEENEELFNRLDNELKKIVDRIGTGNT